MSGLKRPESVLVLVTASQKFVLMMERRQPEGFWQSVTGSLKWGETPRQAAVRELYEETGLRSGAALLDLQHTERFPILGPWRSRYARNAHTNVEHWFGLNLPSRRLIRLNPGEHTRYRWVATEQAQRMAFSWTNRKFIRLWCD